MNLIRLFLTAILCVTCCLSVIPFTCSASQEKDIQTIKEIEIPKYLSIRVEDTLTPKPFFNNISVRDDGWFCLTTTCSDRALNLSYGTYFADVYDSLGEFQFCIRIDRAEDIVYPELAKDTLILYFLKFYISYDLATGELKCFEMQKFLTETSYWKKLEEMKFTIGTKKYRCKSAFEGYTKLIVEENGVETTILSFEGNNRKYLPLLVPLGYAVVAVVLIIARKHKVSRLRTEGDSLP